MFIYVFTSKLFPNEERIITSNFQLNIEKLELLVNIGEDLPILDRWYLNLTSTKREK